MYKKPIMFTLALFTLLGAVPTLSACNTTAGAGKDISNTGQAIERSANEHKD